MHPNSNILKHPLIFHVKLYEVVDIEVCLVD